MKIFIISQVEKEEDVNTECKLYKYLKKQDGIKVKLMHQKPDSGLAYFFYMFLKFLWIYCFFRPDVVLSFQLVSVIPSFYKKFGLIRKAKHIRYWWDDHISLMGHNWGPSFIARLEYYSLGNVDYVFTNSLLQKSLSESLGRPVMHFRLGVEDYFNPAVLPARLPGSHTVKALYIGEQNEYKRVDELIQSFANVPADLILIGKTNVDFKYHAIKDGLKNVHFMGERGHKDIPRYISGADICVIPSDQDGSLKMYEYLKMGKCIFAYKGRIGYILNHRENCWLDRNFERGLKFLVAHPSARTLFEEGARDFKVPGLDESFDKHLTAIRRIVYG